MNRFEIIYQNTVSKISSVMNEFQDKNIRIIYNGLSDADTVAFLMKECGYNIPLIFFETGMEYDATYNHIKKMSNNFRIEFVHLEKSIPMINNEYGTPFISKYVSEMLDRMTKHDFDFKNHGGLDSNILNNLYPKMFVAIKWWNNENTSPRLNIDFDKYLKEFLIDNGGLNFKASNMCCEKIKKESVRKYVLKNNINLIIRWTRSQNFGTKKEIDKSWFFKTAKGNYYNFFPIFWWDDSMKSWYDRERGVPHSEDYISYNFTRNSCAGCPYMTNVNECLKVLEKFEPKTYELANNIFGKSYEECKKYEEYAKRKK